MNNLRKTAIQADAMLFSSLFHKGQFVVPWHQRYYDWKKTDVRALLQDIADAIADDRRCYFLGAIMLVPADEDERRWNINDGQQRMVTISLICAALCRRFTEEARDSQREGHALRMLFDLDDKSILKIEDVEHYTPRISPPENDATLYREIIRGHTIGTKNGLLTTAWLEIEQFLDRMEPEEWEIYFDFIREKLEVACLWIPLGVDPNAVYETINCRGKSLDDFDLIRNFIYSHFNSDEESERKSTVHGNLERIRVAIPNSSRKASDYVRCHLQCIFGFLPKDNLYRAVRKEIRAETIQGNLTIAETRNYIFDLARRISSHELIELFRTITVADPNSDFVRAFEGHSNSTRSSRHLGVFLRELRAYTVSYPLIFAFLIRYVREKDAQRKKRIAKMIHRSISRLTTFVMRTAFVARSFQPSHFEEEFSNFAMKILTSDQLLHNEFVEFLRERDRAEYGVLSDVRFRENMIEADLTGNKKITQFLLGINNYQQTDARLLNESDCTIEHILPKSPQHWSGWADFKDPRDYVNRIGNLTLMSSADNKSGNRFNSNFSRKRDSYGKSIVWITRKLKRYKYWTPKQIESRQKDMIQQAILVWKFP